MEEYRATERNGHQLNDNYDPETNTLDIRSNGLYPLNVFWKSVLEYLNEVEL